MTMKKLLSALLCAALLLCFAGCAKEPTNEVTPTLDTPEASGVLFVSIGAEFKVVYDTEGLVVAVEGTNDDAIQVVSAYSDAVGTACDVVVSKLVEKTVELSANGNNRVVVIKQAPGAAAPSAKFLEDVRLDTASATDFEVVLILADTLTEDGYISADAAKDILTRQLKLTDVAMTCSDVVDDRYTLTFETDGAEQEYLVDAVTGTVILQASAEDIVIPDFDNLDAEPDVGFDDPANDPANDNVLDSPLDEEIIEDTSEETEANQ